MQKNKLGFQLGCLCGMTRSMDVNRLRLQLVDANAGNFANLKGGLHLLGGELTDDSRGLLAKLLLGEGVPVLGDLRLDHASIGSLLLKLLAQLEKDRCALEGR